MIPVNVIVVLKWSLGFVNNNNNHNKSNPTTLDTHSVTISWHTRCHSCSSGLFACLKSSVTRGVVSATQMIETNRPKCSSSVFRPWGGRMRWVKVRGKAEGGGLLCSALVGTKIKLIDFPTGKARNNNFLLYPKGTLYLWIDKCLLQMGTLWDLLST